MKIIYIHHGHRKCGNPAGPDDALTILGYKDCQLVAELLDIMPHKQQIKAIYTSPYFRCKKTAEIINQNLNLKIIEDERLNEYNFSTETWLFAQTRITECIEDIIKQYKEDDYVICVTSGMNVGPFITKAYGLKPSPTAPKLGVPSCSPIVFEYN